MQPALLSVMVLLLFGCAGARPIQRENSARIIPGITFYPDETRQCGPSTLASVMTYWGKPTLPEEIRKDLYSETLEGTLPMDMLPTVEERGFFGTVYEGSLADMKTQVEAGRPLIVQLDLGFLALRAGHFAVVTGYDDARQGVYLNSGTDENVLVPNDRFLSQWNRTDRWTLLVLPRADAPKESKP